jgi:PAS domain S-box-containing protein
MRKAQPRDLPLDEDRYGRLFDNTPVQILEEDFTRVVEAFSRLRSEGVTDLFIHFEAHPQLPHDLLKQVRLTDANRPAIAAAGFVDKPEAIVRFPQHAVAPYLEVFNSQLGAFWAGRRLFGEEFRYLNAGGQECACLMQCRVRERDGQPDYSHVALVLLDVTSAKLTTTAKMENPQLLREILARANILLWWAQVYREAGRLRWKINIPSQSFDSQLYRLATAMGRGGLWDGEHVPELPEITARTEKAILTGSPGYEQEFRVLSDRDGTHWVTEEVGISRVNENEWSLVGVVTDVTARHQAEEGRKESDASLQEILTRADCLLWRARVKEVGGELSWRTFDAPTSRLYVRLFGDRDLWVGGKLQLWSPETTLEAQEMRERSRTAVLSGAPGYEQEFRVVLPDRKLWLHEQTSISPTAPGEWSLVGVLTDVTARHDAEEARKTSEAQLQQLLSQADCMLWQAEVVENMAGVLDWSLYIPRSNLHRELFGNNPSERPHLMWSELSVQELPEMNARSEKALRSGAAGYEQEFCARRESRVYWLHEQVSITPVSRGRWNVVGVITDVTARREAEEARRASETQLQQILNWADCMLWQARVTDVDGKMSWRFDVPASALQRRLFGSEALTGSPVLYDNFMVPEMSKMHVLAATALRGGAPGYEQEFRIIKPEHTYWLHERATIVPQGPGRWLVFGLVIDISALKEAEQTIRASEARYRELFESAVEGVYQSSPEGRFLTVNPSLARIFGCATPEEFMAWAGNGAKELYVRPGRREEFFAELGARNSVTGFESEVYCRDGAAKWVRENVRAVRDAGGHLLYLQGFLSDVTDRRKALASLQQSEARYRALFEKIPVAILEVNLQETGNELRALHAAGVTDLSKHLASHPAASATLMKSLHIASANDTAIRFFKVESKETLENEIARFFHVETIHVLRDFLELIWQGRNDGETELALKDLSGGEHDGYLRWWMPRPDEWLRLENAVIAMVDLTELKRAEAALAAEKERLTVTLRAMSEGVITTDTRGIVQFMNRAAVALTQNDVATAVGRPLAEICVLKEDRSDASFVVPVSQVLEEGSLIDLPPRTTLLGRNGATCLVEGCCAPVHDSGSDRIGTVLVIRDVTVRQRFEEELKRASRLESIGILAGGIAHDFNNILTVIMGNITLAQLDAEALSTVDRYLREAERATLRARDLTQQLLTFAKGGDPVRSAVLLPEIIREITEFALHGSRVKCDFDLPDGLWPADADKGQLGQVVQNLVINAVQAMPEGGTIRIAAANETVAVDTQRPLAPDDYVHVSVADTGTGIKAEHLAKIFDPYFTTKQQGSGLGLTTAYSIIRKHQGHIEVVSELGHGTTFHFWLPAMRENQMEIPEDRNEVMAPIGGRVLFMDDEKTIVAITGMLLKRLGFEVEVACDGAEAVQKFSAAHAAGRPFDLVVLDLTVPGGMGGREAVELLREIDPGVRAIVSSGYSSDPVLANYRAYGFRGMVAKPYKIDDFTRVLRDVLRQSRAQFTGASRPPEKTA